MGGDVRVRVVHPRFEVEVRRGETQPRELGRDGLLDGVRIAKPVCGRVRERLVDDPAPAGADGRPLRLRGRIHAVEDAPEDLRGVRPLERQVPDHALVEEATPSP